MLIMNMIGQVSHSKVYESCQIFQYLISSCAGCMHMNKYSCEKCPLTNFKKPKWIFNYWLIKIPLCVTEGNPFVGPFHHYHHHYSMWWKLGKLKEKFLNFMAQLSVPLLLISRWILSEKWIDQEQKQQEFINSYFMFGSWLFCGLSKTKHLEEWLKVFGEISIKWDRSIEHSEMRFI